MGAAASSITVFMRNRWPSGETSYCCLKGADTAPPTRVVNSGVEEIPEPLARRAAALRRRARRGSVVDALVVAFAEPGGMVLTSDPGGLSALAGYANRVGVEKV